MITPRFISIPRILDPRGNLSFIQAPDTLPFEMKRCYWIYDVPSGEMRGSHALRTQSELIVPLAGSFDVVLDGGDGPRRFHLDRPWEGILVPPMMWRSLDNFSSCSVALVLASGLYDPADYITDFDLFRNER